MKYDDASWHYGGEFPVASPIEYGGTHIGLYLRYCFTKGWASELHTEFASEAVDDVVHEKLSGTDFLFRYCDGKFTNEDLNEEGNAFTRVYYDRDDGYLADYANLFADIMYIVPESEHNFRALSNLIDDRIASGDLF